MNPIEAEKYERVSRLIEKSREAMKRHEYLLRDRPAGKPPDNSSIGE